MDNGRESLSSMPSLVSAKMHDLCWISNKLSPELSNLCSNALSVLGDICGLELQDQCREPLSPFFSLLFIADRDVGNTHACEQLRVWKISE